MTTGGEGSSEITESTRHHTESMKTKMSEQRGLGWEIILPTGELQTIKSLTRFCRQIGLDSTAMGRVAKGIASHHKGYHCRKLTSEERLPVS